ncbi:MAG: hypothetical protein V3U15_05920 [Nitrospinota bacterium]
MSDRQQVIKQIGKTQYIRIFDYALLGPALIGFGLFKKKLSPIERILFIGIGSTTMGYNFNNWLIQKKIIDNIKNPPARGDSIVSNN